LHRYPKDKFLVLDKTSHHQEGHAEEKVWFLFPNLLKHPRIKFIRWSEYDQLKSSVQELEIPWKIFYEIDGFTSGIKKFFRPDEDYESLTDKYSEAFRDGLRSSSGAGGKYRKGYLDNVIPDIHNPNLGIFTISIEIGYDV
jgi:hypothetical protein